MKKSEHTLIWAKLPNEDVDALATLLERVQTYSFANKITRSSAKPSTQEFAGTLVKLATSLFEQTEFGKKLLAWEKRTKREVLSPVQQAQRSEEQQQRYFKMTRAEQRTFEKQQEIIRSKSPGYKTPPLVVWDKELKRNVFNPVAPRYLIEDFWGIELPPAPQPLPNKISAAQAAKEDGPDNDTI